MWPAKLMFIVMYMQWNIQPGRLLLHEIDANEHVKTNERRHLQHVFELKPVKCCQNYQMQAG